MALKVPPAGRGPGQLHHGPQGAPRGTGSGPAPPIKRRPPPEAASTALAPPRPAAGLERSLLYSWRGSPGGSGVGRVLGLLLLCIGTGVLPPLKLNPQVTESPATLVPGLGGGVGGGGQHPFMEELDQPRLGLQPMLTLKEDNGSEHLCDGLRAQLRSLFPDEGANAVPQRQALGLRCPLAVQAR